MLVIRKSQMKVFQNHMFGEFVNRSSRIVRADYGEETKDISDEDLRAIINAGIQKAKSYGIKYEDDVLQYLRYIIRYGAEFDADPKFSGISEILDKDIDGTMKIILVNEYIESNTMEKR